MVKILLTKDRGVVQELGDGIELDECILSEKFYFLPVTYSSDTTLNNENVVFGDAEANAITLTLPSADIGQCFRIKKIDSTTKTVTILPQTGELIDSETELEINEQNVCSTIIASGSN